PVVRHEPGPDQPDGGLERAGRGGMDRRFASRASSAVAGRRGADGRGAGQAGAGRPRQPGQPAGHRRVHRLWPAVHADRLLRAGTAAGTCRGRRRTGARRSGWNAMTRWTWLGLLLPVATLAGVRDDYARQWPLELGQPDAGAYRVVLDEQVYRAVQSRDLRDLQVVDADGNPVATAVQRAGRPVEAAVPDVEVPWFALPRGGGAAGGLAGDLSVAVERDAAGRITRIRNAVAVPRHDDTAARDPAWLVDLGGQ